jgi:predicted nucleic acid-binding protein
MFLSIPRVETPWYPLLGTKTFDLARESSLTYYDAAYVALFELPALALQTVCSKATAELEF